MNKIDLPLWSDTLFFFICNWLISLCIFRYYRLAPWLSLLLCTVFSAAASALFFFLLSRNRRKKFLAGRDKEEKEKLTLHLALSDEKSNRALLAPLLSDELSEKKVFLLFCMQPLSADEIANGIKRTNGQSFTVYCNELSPQARELCERFLITVRESKEIYEKLKAADALPEKYICGEKQKSTFRKRAKIYFHKSNCRSFFISGAALLVLSLFSFFPLYYVISGSLLLLAALFIRIFGYA